MASVCCSFVTGSLGFIITTNRRYHRNINSAHAPLNREDGAYLQLRQKKRPLISDHIKRPLVAAFSFITVW